MRAQDPSDVFYVTFSKWKVWCYSIFFLIITCIPLLPMVMFTKAILADKTALTSDYVFLMLILGICVLFCLAGSTVFLVKLKAPLITLTRRGFSGTRNFKHHDFAWGPNVIIFPAHKGVGLIIAKFDATQSRSSALWKGPNEWLLLHGVLAKEKSQTVLDAVNRLSPYAVKQTRFYGADK